MKTVGLEKKNNERANWIVLTSIPTVAVRFPSDVASSSTRRFLFPTGSLFVFMIFSEF